MFLIMYQSYRIQCAKKGQGMGSLICTAWHSPTTVRCQRVVGCRRGFTPVGLKSVRKVLKASEDGMPEKGGVHVDTCDEVARCTLSNV